jgi:chemotaxis protein methyltransferase CheR
MRLESNPDEWAVLDSHCGISISRFYRDRGVFDCLRDEILPELAAIAVANGESELRCWSAGCASGEEPYTINIIWKMAVAPRVSGLKLKIIATDSNPQLLDRARRGCYPRSSLKDFPTEWLSSCFAQVDDEYCVHPEYRSDIDWLEQDIRRETPPGEFHIILCRHLAFTYFAQPLQHELLRSMVAKLHVGGVFVTGKQESLPSVPGQLDSGRSEIGVYRKVE